MKLSRRGFLAGLVCSVASLYKSNEVKAYDVVPSNGGVKITLPDPACLNGHSITLKMLKPDTVTIDHPNFSEDAWNKGEVYKLDEHGFK